jgi:hypothetical protein
MSYCTVTVIKLKDYEKNTVGKCMYIYNTLPPSHKVNRGLAVMSHDDVIDGRPPCWRYFFRAAWDVLMEITLENGRK